MKPFLRSLAFVVRNDPDNSCLMRSYLRTLDILIEPGENVLDRAIGILVANGISIDLGEVLYRSEMRSISEALAAIGPGDDEARWELIDRLQLCEIEHFREKYRTEKNGETRGDKREKNKPTRKTSRGVATAKKRENLCGDRRGTRNLGYDGA